jgi:hypothetical protein
MAGSPKATSQYVFGPRGLEDALHFTDPNGKIVSWVDSNGFLQGNLANSTTISFSGTPTGNCTVSQTAVNTGTGDFYSCSSGTWVKVGPTAGSLVSPVTSPNPLSFDVNLAFKGPNPYVDVTRFGVRSVASGSAPAVSGITANCVSSNTSITISSASTFQNGDGVVLYNCGSASSLTTPTGVTVTPSVAVGGVQTGFVGNAPSGSTTYNYQVIAVDKAGGYTAASSVASTTTGAATLGYNNATITGCTRTNDVVTCTTSTNHGFNVGCNAGNCGQVWISGITDTNSPNTSFNGWWQVASAADTTHFTWQGNADTRLGAATSGGSGTARWWNCNHVTWTAVPNAWLYYIYGRTGGSLTLLAVSKPQSSSSSFVLDTTWDDFGATMVGSPIALPGYIPTTPPGSAGNDYLVTTISSGAGTTTLTLANAPSNSVSGTTILFDNTPNFITAATTYQNSYPQSPCLHFPVDTTASGANGYVFNSFINLASLSNPVCISQAGTVVINDTLQFLNGMKWYGDRITSTGQTEAFAFQGNPQVLTRTGAPMIYGDNSSLSSSVFSGLLFIASDSFNSASQLFVADGGFNFTFENCAFFTHSTNNDYTSIGLNLRNIYPAQGIGEDSAFGQLHRMYFVSGLSFNGAGGDGSSNAPIFFCNGCSQIRIYDMFTLGRGIFYRGDSRGTNVSALAVDYTYAQGSVAPLITVSEHTGDVQIGSINADSIAHPVIAVQSSNTYTDVPTVTVSNLLGAFNKTPLVANISGFGLTGLKTSLKGITFLNYSNSSSLIQGAARDSLLYASGGPYLEQYHNGAIAVGASYPAFVMNAPNSSPTCVISAGGSANVGTWYFAVAPVWQNGGEGIQSYPSAPCVTTTGNQTITVNWAAQPGFPKSYNVYYAFGTPGTATLCVANVNALTLSIPSSGTCQNGSAPTIPSGGPTMLMPGVQGIATPAILSAQFNSIANCNVNSVSPAACGSAPSGTVVVPTTTTTYTVNTTAITANSRIIIHPITDGSGLSGSPTCNAPPTPFTAYQSARVAGTSFTFTLPSTSGTSCWTYWVVN